MAFLSGEKRPLGLEAEGKEEASVASRVAEVRTLLGKGSEFDGKLAFEGHLRIDGRFKGSIRTNDVLIIGESAEVTAEIEAGTVIVSGSFQGTIRAKQLVELHAPARVRGTIDSNALTIEKGVLFDGTTKMSEADTPHPAALPAK